VTDSFVTVLTTFGPVTNMYDVSRTMNTKSVMAGEYTAPPAQGPMMTLICRRSEGAARRERVGRRETKRGRHTKRRKKKKNGGATQK
jgi:hypothetical protein